MAIVIRIMFFLMSALVFPATIAKAQVQLMPAINLLLADGNAFGVGSISGRYFVSSRTAAGLNVRYIPTTRLALATLEADYFFNTAKSIRPFVGLEAGTFTKYRNAVYTTWGVAPKIGLQGKFSPLMSVQLEVSRPIAIDKGEGLGADAGFLIGAGLNFSIGADK